MKYHQVSRRWLMIPALMLAVPGVTHAAAGYISVSNLTLPTVEVVGNGVEYTGIKPAVGGAWQAGLSIGTSGGARIKSWSLRPHVEGGIGLPALDFSQYAASRSYPVGSRPASVNKTVGQIFPLGVIADHAIARCNLNRMKLESQGHSHADIFGQIHQLTHDDLSVKVDVDLTIGNQNVVVEGAVHQYQVICLAHDPTPQVPTAGALVSPFQVTGASLSVSPGHKVQTACPVELNFNGTIHTSGTVPATVQYRFEWPTGEVSTVFSAQVANPAEGLQVSHQVQMPLPSAAVPQPQGGGGGAVPGGFAQVQQPPPPPGPLPEGVPPQPEGPKLKGATLPANEHKNSVRLVVLSHGGASSGPAGYHIVCEPRVRPGLGGPGGMAVPDPGHEHGSPVRPVITGTVPNPGATPPAGLRTPKSSPSRNGDEVLRRGSDPESPDTRESGHGTLR